MGVRQHAWPFLVSLCIVIGITAIVMLQCLGCCDVFMYSSALNSMYYEQLDILPVLGVHNFSQVVACGSKRGPRPSTSTLVYGSVSPYSDMITLPNIINIAISWVPVP